MNCPPSSKSSRGRATVNVAVWVLGIMLVAQVGAVGWALHRKRHQQAGLLASPTGAGAEVATHPTAGAVDPPSAAEPAVVAPVVPPPSPSEGPISDPKVLFFLESALSNREKGDMKAALTQLRAACDLLPDHPRLLYELATTYEAMALTEKAEPLWDQIFRLGESAGLYFRIAQSRFEQGDAKPPREVEVPLQLGKVLERTLHDPNYAEHITLRIPVQARDGAVIDPGRVSVVTQFYDMAGGEIVETDALTGDSRWLSGKFPTWITNSVELLDQPYRRKEAAAENAGGAAPRYYGYVVKLYYNNHLQDVMARPEQLVSRVAEPGERGVINGVDIPPARPQLDDSLFPLPQ